MATDPAHAAAQARYQAKRNAGIPARTYQRRARPNQESECTQLVRELKEGPCADCGGSWPAVAMDLDHVRGEKVLNIAMIVRRNLVDLLLSELGKCDLVCASCHRVRTAKRIAVEREAMARGLHNQEATCSSKPLRTANGCSTRI